MYQQLISANQLQQLISTSAENLIILDASIPPITGMEAPEYSWPKSCIANAKRFDINKEFCEQTSAVPHTMPTAQQFTEQAQKLGINSDSQIVVYDHFGIFSSARAWWMFKAMGHHQVAVLNGGLPAWLQAGFAITNALEIMNNHKRGNFVGCYQPDYFCDQEWVLQALNNSEQQIIDARSAGRFSGQEAEPRAGVRSGHIPSAINMHYKSLQENGCLLEKSQLQQAFNNNNIQHKPLIMSCGSGVTACILALAATILDYEDICVYDGSWSEWGADDNLPIMK